MAISWTHTIEERLSRLERRQERLMGKLAALTDALNRKVDAAKAADSRAAAVSPGGAGVPAPHPGSPLADGKSSDGTHSPDRLEATGRAPDSSPAGSEKRQPAQGTGASSPVVEGDGSGSTGPDPGGSPQSPAAIQGAQPPGGLRRRREGPHRPQAASTRRSSRGSREPAPMSGGQGSGLTMWRPTRGPSLRDRRHRILSRVEELTETVSTLSTAVQRLQVMCELLGQCVYIAVDPEAARRFGSGAAAPGSGGESRLLPAGTDTAGGNDLAGNLAQTLTGLLPGLLGKSAGGDGTGSSGAAAESGDTAVASGTGADAGAADSAGSEPADDDTAGESEGGGGGTGAGSAGGTGSGVAGGVGGINSLHTLLPLVQALATRSGSGEAAQRMGALLASPAFRQLMGMVEGSNEQQK